MNLPEISINRYVLAYMLSGVLVLFGLVSYERIGVDRNPAIEFPMITVSTALPGANPESIDSSVTNIIESAVNSIPGIEHIESTSNPGVSIVAIRFALEKSVDVAFNDVQAKVNQVLRQLPTDADPPVVAKVEFGSMPIMWLTLSGNRTLQQLNLYASNTIKKRLETIDGVGEVRIGGSRERTIRINLDPSHMAAYQVTPQEVMAAFRREHLQLPGGFMSSGTKDDLIKLDTEFHRVDELAGLIVAYRGGLNITLRDIAKVEDSLADYRSLARYNGEPTVGIGIVKIANTNTVAIVEEVMRRLDKEIIPQLPPGMAIGIATNEADLISDIIEGLKSHLVEGTLLAALVVWLFLKNLRSTLIVSAAIPVSLLGAVAVMYFAGYTFNIMTMLALLLLIGVVVDDAIVVLENIYRTREENRELDSVAAAKQGTRQVVFAVLAASLTLMAIFAPVIFMKGIIGQFFQSFAVVVTVGVLVSLLVSLTLTPMLCSRYLSIPKRHGRLYRLLDRAFQAMDESYRTLLGLGLRHRWKVVILTVLVVMSSGYFFGHIGKGFMPEEDESRFMITFKTPTGSSIDYTAERLDKVEAVLQSHPEVRSTFSLVGGGRAESVNSGSVIVRLVPQTERTMRQAVMMKSVQQELNQIPGVQAFASQIPMVGGNRGEPLQFSLVGPDLYKVAELAGKLKQRLADDPKLGQIDMTLVLDLPQVELELARSRLASLGISPLEVAQAINVLGGGVNIAKYNDVPGDGERYDVRLKAGDGQVTRPTDLARLYVRASNGEMIRLDNLARLNSGVGPAVISRYDLQYSANFYGTPTVAEGDAARILNQHVEEVGLPLGYQVRLKGRAEEFTKTAGYMALAFVMAIVLVYMVLASQFNSFIQPLIIMVAQPLAIIGGGVGLWLMNHSLNIYSMIGLVLLIGLVAKNSILLVDLTNQLRAQGKGISDALLEACPIRMRPVVMTSLTVILAMLPAASGVGAGADTNGPLAVAVIGGMISSTLLTLVVVPAVYSLVENGLQQLREWQARVSVRFFSENV
jgi:HAE1 family hydrophobic/amphiphilic exporter-1